MNLSEAIRQRKAELERERAEYEKAQREYDCRLIELFVAHVEAAEGITTTPDMWRVATPPMWRVSRGVLGDSELALKLTGRRGVVETKNKWGIDEGGNLVCVTGPQDGQGILWLVSRLTAGGMHRREFNRLVDACIAAEIKPLSDNPDNPYLQESRNLRDSGEIEIGLPSFLRDD